MFSKSRQIRLLASIADEDLSLENSSMACMDESKFGLGLQSLSPSVVSIEDESSFNLATIVDPKFSLAVQLVRFILAYITLMPFKFPPYIHRLSLLLLFFFRDQ